jgi:hypothetical protein
MTKSEAEMRKDLEEQQERARILLAKGKKGQFMDELVLSSKKALEDVEDLPFRGRRMGDAEGYKTAKKMVGDLFAKVDRVYRGMAPYPLQELMRFSDSDYLIATTQGLDVWGLVERDTAELDPRLRIWLALGIYAYEYEFSSKTLMSLAQVLTDKPCETSGLALSILKERFGARELDGYFDSFLRNAIDHSEFILKDKESGKIEAWKTTKKGKTRKEYDIAMVSDMTVKLLFFTMAYHSNWYERVIQLDRIGRLRLGS